ncbi:MAG: type II toxin-antitoxin system VapC family toxin [Gemmatimonadota bacterium]
MPVDAGRRHESGQPVQELERGEPDQLRPNLTAYDACYVALAEALEATLVTCDGPLARTPGHRARIEMI